jgi:hypothetical protein
VFLHVGAPKTGTTYLQRLLDANRDRLGGLGVLYPDLGNDAHHTAAWGLRPKRPGKPSSERFGDQWDKLVEQARGWSGPSVVVSTEMFVFFDDDLAAKVLGAFGDAEVHIIYTARDLVRQVPAVWQEQVKNQRTDGYRAFVSDLLGRRSESLSRHFWRSQDAPRALARWSHGIGPERVHVVTAPPPGARPELLWERFAEVIGVDPAVAVADSPAANTSLGIAAAAELRRFNERYGAAMPLQRYRRDVLRPLMPALASGVIDDRRLPLSEEQQRRISQHSEEIVAGIRAAGYDVVGTLDDLVPQQDRPARGRPAPGPDDLSDAEVVDALLDVLHHLTESGQITAQLDTDRRGRGKKRPAGKKRGAGKKRPAGKKRGSRTGLPEAPA